MLGRRDYCVAKMVRACGGCQRAKYARWLLESKNVAAGIVYLKEKVSVAKTASLPLGKKSWLIKGSVTKMVMDDTILERLLIAVYLVLVFVLLFIMKKRYNN